MNKYYKICYIRNGIPLSYGAGAYQSGGLEYKLGEFVYPNKPGHYLSVFNNLSHAQEFLNEWGFNLHKLFECEIEGLCQGESNYSENIFTGIKHPGAVFVYGVKLIKEVVQEVVLKAGDIVEKNDNYYIVANLKTSNWWGLMDTNGVLIDNGVYKNIVTEKDLKCKKVENSGFRIEHGLG